MFDHLWNWKKRLPDRFGKRCRVLVRGALNNVLVEFEDGYKAVASRYAVRIASVLDVDSRNFS